MCEKDLIRRIQDKFKGKVFLFEHAGHTYNRCSITNRVRFESLRVLGKEFHMHSFRHTFTTDMIKKLGLKGTSVYIGHAQPSLTAKMYDHYKISWEDLKNASG